MLENRGHLDQVYGSLSHTVNIDGPPAYSGTRRKHCRRQTQAVGNFIYPEAVDRYFDNKKEALVALTAVTGLHQPY